MEAIQMTSAWWSAVFKEATLLLHVYIMQKCSTCQQLKAFNLTFFRHLITCVTSHVPYLSFPCQHYASLTTLTRPKFYILPLNLNMCDHLAAVI